MKTTDLQNSIINKVLNTDDVKLLDYLNQILSEGKASEIYQLSEFEKSIIAESKADYLAGNTIPNEDVFNRNDQWLNG